MDNYKGPGKTLTLAAPYDRTSGQGALVGSIFGVAIGDVDSGDNGEFLTEGEFMIAKLSTDIWTVGQKLYWDDTNKRLDEDSTVGPCVATAVAVTANPSSTGQCVLTGVSENPEGAQAHIADIATADGSDAATTQALANATKAKFNTLLAELRLAGVLKSS